MFTIYLSVGLWYIFIWYLDFQRFWVRIFHFAREASSGRFFGEIASGRFLARSFSQILLHGSFFWWFYRWFWLITCRYEPCLPFSLCFPNWDINVSASSWGPVVLMLMLYSDALCQCMRMMWWMMLILDVARDFWCTMTKNDATHEVEIWCWCLDLMNDVNDTIMNDTMNDAATWCRFTIADERCQWQIRRVKLRFDADALIWSWMMSIILWMIRWMTRLLDAGSPLPMNDAKDWCDGWSWYLMLTPWSDEWYQWYCEWYDACCHPCGFTIADGERCHRQIWWMKLGSDADALIWDLMNDANDMIWWMMQRMTLILDADAPLLMNDANERCDE